MRLGDAAREVVQTALRLAPWPTEPGLRSVGSPNDLSPVLVTCNYDLTVRRLLRALNARNVDAWIVVAPSGGINVWCAAAGGLLTTHQVVTALRTSGVEQRVRHRRAILPQLAATGVLAREVSRRCGWRTRFGPVRAEDIPRYLEAGTVKSDDMRHVRFGLSERLEMAFAWAAPIGAVFGLVAAWFAPAWAWALVALAAVLSVTQYLVYDRIPGRWQREIFGGAAVVLALAGALALGGGGAALFGAVAIAVAMTALLTFDYPGNTPIEGGSHFEERRWHIRLDLERCEGVYSCWEVCPEACFDKREDVRKIALAHEERCVRCGACIVQCPMDALAFENQDGQRVEPDTIRRFKLNLMGRRSVDAGEEPRAS